MEEENKQIYYTDQIKLDFGIPYPFELMNGDMKKMDEIVGKGDSASDAEKAFLIEHANAYRAIAALRLRQKYAEAVDPVVYGWNMPIWRKVMEYWDKAKVIIFFGGNRASKSICASRIVTQVGNSIPEANIRCFHQNEKRSKEEQQKHVYEALPLDYMGVPVKNSKKSKGKNFDVSYKQKTGFSGNKCILPPFYPTQTMGSVINFNTYQQFYANHRVFEGSKEHLIWMDEEAPLKLFETLLPRLADYHGKMLLTFTTIDGYTDLVNSLLSNVKTLEDVYVPWLGEKTPLVQKSLWQEDCYIFYFHSQENPFVDWTEMWKTYAAASNDVKKTRLLGIPTKLFISKFPKFSQDVHVIEPNKIPFEQMTKYHSVDPAGGKPWVQIWGGVDKKGDIYIYREFPKMSEHGEWALPWKNAVGRPVGKAGPAQRGIGLGYRGYADLIKKIEKTATWRDGFGEPIKEEIFERIIDMRYAHREVMADEGTVNMAAEMEKYGLYFRGGYESDIETGIQKINDMLDYDPSKPIDDKNRPKLYISSDCGNLISCMQSYTAEGGREEASKDFIDTLRMFLTTEPVYVAPGRSIITGGFAY